MVAEHELPSVVNSEVRKKLYNQFVSAFNAGDDAAMYDLLAPAARASLSRDLVESETQKLRNYLHSIENGGFTHSELVETQGNTNIYNLY